jgi:hypothetical protein
MEGLTFKVEGPWSDDSSDGHAIAGRKGVYCSSQLPNRWDKQPISGTDGQFDHDHAGRPRYFCSVPVRWSYIFLVSCFCCVPVALQAQTTNLLDVADSLILHVRWRKADTVLNQVDEAALSETDLARFKLYRSCVLEQRSELDKATTLALEAMTMAQRLQLPEIEASAHLKMALIQEIVGEPRKSSVHLDKALQLIKDHGLEELYAHYYVRRSSLIRVSTNDRDSLKQAERLAQLATEYGERYRRHGIWQMGTCCSPC